MSIPNEPNPIALFRTWYDQAAECTPIAEPSAATLATIDDVGMPWARFVLLKQFDDEGFVIYTNLGSRKAEQLTAHPKAALCFYWMPLDRQVRVQGTVQPVTEAEADAYFATRERKSQIGAWASKQSQPLEDNLALEKRVAKFVLKFGVGTIPRPPFWSGFRIIPERIEFWLKQPYRLHDRAEYVRTSEAWQRRRLYP